MTEQPVITVGIPVYNEEKFLPETIESVLNQTIKNISILICDNCSTDSTYEIAKSFEVRDSRIKVFRHKENIGIPRNFKFASDKAESKYFIWLGAHDKFEPDYLKRAIEFLEENKNVLMVYPNGKWIDRDNKFISNLEEDIQTTGLSRKDALIKIMTNTDSGIATHGVFVTSELQQIPFAMDVGLELMIFFIIVTRGDIAKLNYTGLLFREVRKETVSERMKRYKEIKIVRSSFIFTLVRIKKHLAYTWKTKELSFGDKIQVSYHVLRKLMLIFVWIQYRKFFSDKEVQTVKR